MHFGPRVRLPGNVDSWTFCLVEYQVPRAMVMRLKGLSLRTNYEVIRAALKHHTRSPLGETVDLAPRYGHRAVSGLPGVNRYFDRLGDRSYHFWLSWSLETSHYSRPAW